MSLQRVIWSVRVATETLIHPNGMDTTAIGVKVVSSQPSAAQAAAAIPQPSALAAAVASPRQAASSLSEQFMRLIHFVWRKKGAFTALILLVAFLRKLRRWSRSRHEECGLSGELDPRLFPKYIVSPSTGLWLYTRSWVVPGKRERAIVFIVHAYREHIGRYDSLAQSLNAAGVSVYGMDLQGHGQSGGDRGYVECFAHYVSDYMAFIRHVQVQREAEAEAEAQAEASAQSQAQAQSSSSSSSSSIPSLPLPSSSASRAVKPCFILGHSLGSTIALQLARIEEWRIAAEEEDRDREREAESGRDNGNGNGNGSAASHASRAKHVESIAEEGEGEETETDWEAATNPEVRSIATDEEDEEKQSASMGSSGTLVASQSLGASVMSIPSPSSTSPAASLPPSPPSSAARTPTQRWRINGLILSSPAIIPHEATVSPLLQTLASALADVLPKFGFSTVLPLKQMSRDPDVVTQFFHDPLTFKGFMPARFGCEMLDVMAALRAALTEITIPILVLQGSDDRFISPAGAGYVIGHVSSEDRSLKVYDNAAHDIYLEGETRQRFTNDVIQWIMERSGADRS